MTVQQNTDRIQTTHIGSLPRPHRLLDVMKAKYSGEPYDEAAFAAALRTAVTDVVRRQVDCGIDIVTDGEFSKPGFFTYVRERLDGFETRQASSSSCSSDDGRRDRAAGADGLRRA
jgi:5-methyltetrahydropteroyltriglutamate--homocysteine methyltransferase